MSHESSNARDVRIAGMHCASCELAIERKLKKVRGVLGANVDHRSGTATVRTDPRHPPNDDDIAAAIAAAGYALSDDRTPTAGFRRKWLEVGASLIVILALYQLLKTFDLVSLAPSTTGVLSLGAVFAIGLVAGTSSCLAVTGGLLLAIAAKHNERHGSETPWRKFRPLLHFNVGRLASYFVLGGLVGVLGRSLALTPQMTGYANIVIALIMLCFSLSILQILPANALRMPKVFTRRIADLSDSDHPAAPASLGALTFFLPCGFTQSLQLVALASGNFLVGAAVMFTFALGTLPFLLGVGALSVTLKGSFSRAFLRFSGVLVFVLALFNLQTGLALSGIGFGPSAASEAASVPKGGVQEVAMAVTDYGYEPSSITIDAGVPVRWIVDGTSASGCTGVLTIPSLGISRVLARGENVIEFTASKKGRLAFMCSMGMVRGAFNVL